MKNSVFGLTIQTRAGYFYMNFSANLNDLIKDIKDYMKDADIDDSPPSEKEIKERINSSLYRQFIRELSDNSVICIMPIPKVVKMVITVKRGSIDEVKANLPVVYYVKDYDEVDPREWTTPYKAKLQKTIRL